MEKNASAIKFAGQAGQGVESNGGLLARTMARGGLHVFGSTDYESRIRGGLNFFRIDVDEQPVHAHGEILHVLLAQLPGPATGLATRTEQADLKFALSAGHGEFPRILLAPGSIEECFEAGWRAFNLAEVYQTPVIVLTEHFLATSARTVDPAALDLSRVSIDRGVLLDDASLDDLDMPHFASLIRQAMDHPGYALIDTLQVCVTFNPTLGYKWYSQRVYKLDEEEGYDTGDLASAMQRALQWGDRIPIGVLYRDADAPSYESQVPALADGPLVDRPLRSLPIEAYEAIKREFI